MDVKIKVNFLSIVILLDLLAMLNTIQKAHAKKTPFQMGVIIMEEQFKAFVINN